MARCLVFHIASNSGAIVIFAIPAGEKDSFYLAIVKQLLIAPAITLISVVFFNFTVRHLFTYSGKKAP